MTFGLQPHNLNAIIQCLAESTGIEEAILYGSRAKGNYKNGSDIDLTLKGKDLSLSDVFQLENQLDDLLLPYKFDISIYDHIEDTNFLEHMQRVGVVFYKRD